MTVDNVFILKGDKVAGFEVGKQLERGGQTTDETVIRIKITIFGTVKIFLSSNKVIIFRGCPINYEI